MLKQIRSYLALKDTSGASIKNYLLLLLYYKLSRIFYIVTWTGKIRDWESIVSNGEPKR